MIDQLTVFLGNEEGRLTALCRTLGDADIQMHSLVLADTTDYGIVRIICDNPKGAIEALSKARFTASLAKVVAVEVPHVPGGLAGVFAALDKLGVNIEYSYCFIGANGVATLALKAPESVMGALDEAGFKVLHPGDLYAA
ncbi:MULTISPECIES: amino acid-binding protein [unclassified Adlercreutzia]|uniref:amino acid-binding protein n=1 Tax=unclassified Adlercreutzia TaxID=2636013 RepID=UPI0013EA3CEA|nr:MULTISPECIES: amino acid-binding protein [unclassified Adlercreutzia]